MAFSPDGKSLISATRDAVLVLHPLADVIGKGPPGEGEGELAEQPVGLETLWSEDFENGRLYGRVRTRDPFIGA